MMPPDDSNPQSTDVPSPEGAQWEQQLAAIEASLVDLKARRAQIVRGTRERSRLQSELQRLQQRITDLETDLESRLLSWKDFKEPFWQVVRFGGIGFLLGWALKSCAG
ncbi:hypothetical protein KR51_00030130 [Rubidibacter lacunae KORDI 51-2]|uniref:DUF2203 domain-containing protein n=1 Tax=Rubidibacter lacunae KORDI 51-2 TaxID=582515 RepID=U5DIP9_9CHRO|nr:hypothetical protein [Rubidibacter lacunae]ERN40469.1 hypothetical protein KR51_00030130 [Rubidibacter lacunae KORDI 51-2]